MFANVWFYLQILSVIFSLIITVYMLSWKSSREQKLMVLLSLCTFAYNYGYTLLITSKGYGMALANYRFSGLGLSFFPFILLLFTDKILKHKRFIPIYLITGTNLIANLILLIIFDSSDLLMKSITFREKYGIKYLDYIKGPFWYIDVIISLLVYQHCVGMCAKTIIQKKSKSQRRYYFMYFNFIALMYIGFILSKIFAPGPIDVFPMICSIECVMLAIEVKQNNLFELVTSVQESVVENMPEAIIVLDKNYTIICVNEMGRKFFPGIYAEERKPLPDRYRYLLDNPEVRIDLVIEGRHLERTVTSFSYEKAITGYALQFSDVTMHHEMLKQTRRLAREAEAANISKTHFLTNVSHEIRTPMNAIVGYSELIMHEVTSNEGKEYAESIRRSSMSLLHIINDIIDFSKIEQGKLEIVEADFSTEGLFDEIVDIMQVPAEQKGIQFVTTLPPDFPSVCYGDRLRIRQSLLNVIGNAIKYTNEGSVRFMTEWEENVPGVAHIKILISDTGIGIADADKERILADFERADIAKNYNESGTGLGLAITKALLKLMNGDIGITSEYGVGTNVVIILDLKIVDRTPISAENNNIENAAVYTESYEKLDAPDARVLVVDDNRVNIEVMRNLLKSFHIVPDTALSGAEALKLVENTYYDIVFMDQMMPEMDGTETMQNIRKMSSRHKDMKIVVVTANAVAGVRNELIGAGFTDYAAKPVTVSTLKLMLTKYLPQGRKTISSEEKMATRGQGHKGIEETFSSDILKLPEYIDRAEGLKNAGGDISVYRSVIEVICSCASEVITKIKDFFEEKDLKNYSILAHSMKSNAATVGYSMLAEFAKQQEVAARNGSVEEVEAGGQHFISEYEKFINDMEECLRETDRRASRNEKTGGDTDTEQNQSINISKTNKQAEEYKLTLREAVRCINCERYEDAMDLFDILYECSIPPVVKNILTEVKKDIQAKNWGKVTEMLESYM